jgi:hypothetical protein
LWIFDLLQLLKKVQFYLEEGNLPFYWEEKCNMLNMTASERQNWACRLKNLISKFEENWEKCPASIGDTISKYLKLLS